MRTDVVALYVDPRGPYSKLVEQWYGEARDGKTYVGPLPIVAHPPCGPWGRLRHLSKNQDPWCGIRAVEQVRSFGGVLEHPSGSKLWEHCNLPKPGDLPDAYGGRTIEVCQVNWGHVARKRTWLYLVGIPDVGPLPPRREPTHWVSGRRVAQRPGEKWRGGIAPPGIKFCSAEQRRRTPITFAEWLLTLAAGARR